MPASTAPAPSAIPGTSAIRVGIALLAAFAFALSYDALRQMAVAIHIRGLLTYAFPLVIDGFIAIGVGALLMLRTAPLRSRVYVWALVGAATTTSIWANALHAVRLNEQSRHGEGLRLDDVTVGVLSAIAPLALAGAVHLYIVIRRQPAARQAADTTPGDVASDATDVAKVHVPAMTPHDQLPADVSAERLSLARSAPLGRHGRASRRHIEAIFREKDLTIGRVEADQLKGLVQEELDAAADRPELGAEAA
ncbi:DUF2637 domain-containing protein [Streptomyces sp. NBC_01016]|uniref:DUF2637 domain-containing protein n=1 Tax=Streptomyces sp. NBC_01016 TaxID=2903720 RepID=UPI00224E85E3|nr:DUF2637 domain-containing protein [Streptomyces sp. NBC_01016]MCX4828312.1 DUF2637 domain-containing protein [Streptomyces sp. NBC_01016]